MILDVFDSSLKRIANISKYSYAQYTDQLNGSGSFTIKVPLNADTLYYLSYGKYILFEKEVMGEMLQISSSRNEEQGKKELSTTGKLIKRFMSFRCFIKTANYTGTVTSVTRQFITDNFIAPSDSKRVFPGMHLSTNEKYIPASDSLTLQVTGDSVEAELESLYDTYEMGYDVVPVIETVTGSDGDVATNISGFEFRVIKGLDLTVGNTAGNDKVEFSFDMKNLISSQYVKNESAYKNVAYVAGEGEGVARMVIPSGDTSLAGRDRIELYVDARDCQSTDENGNALTTGQYTTALVARGDSSLAENITSETFTCSINTYTTQFVYGRDYQKGDLVTIRDKDLDLAVSARVTAVQVTSMGNKEMLDITFGYQRLLSLQKLKRGGVL
jgi:hypothetical protein